MWQRESNRLKFWRVTRIQNDTVAQPMNKLLNAESGISVGFGMYKKEFRQDSAPSIYVFRCKLSSNQCSIFGHLSSEGLTMAPLESVLHKNVDSHDHKNK